MQEDNLQAPEPIELYNTEVVDPVPEEEKIETIPKAEPYEKSIPDFSELSEGTGDFGPLTYKAPKVEELKKTIEIKYDAQGKPIIYGASETEQIFKRLYKAARGEQQEPQSNYNYIEQASAGLIHASIKMPHTFLSLGAELGDFVRGNGIPIEDRYITKLEDAINGSFIGRIEKESKDIKDTGAVGIITDGLAQLYGGGKIGAKIVSTPLNNMHIKKIAENYVAAVKADKLVKPSINLGRAMEKANNLNNLSTKDKFIAIAIGGAGFGAGAALVADAEDIGTFGDLLKQEFGLDTPSTIDRFKKEDSRDEAVRKLYNRLKFGTENAVVSIPFAYGAGLVQEIAKYGKEMAYSNSQFSRWIDKYVTSNLRARGNKSQALFEELKTVEGTEGATRITAKDLLRDIDQSLGKVAKESGISTGNPAFKRIIGRLDELLVSGEDSIHNGKLMFTNFPAKTINEFKEFAKEVGLEAKQVNNLTAELINVRNQFSVLKNNLLNSENIQLATGEFNQIMSERMRNMFNSEYRIMTDRSVIPFLNYKPAAADIESTKNVLARYAKSNGKVLKPNELDDMMNDIINNVNYNDITKTPQFVIGEQSVLSDKATQLINIADNIKGGKFKPSELIKTKEDLRSFQRLFGQKRDIRNTVVNVMSDLATLNARDNFYNQIVKLSDDAIKNGERAITYPTYNSAITGLKNREIISGKNGLQIKSPLGEDVYTNPLNGRFTSKEFADAVQFSEKSFWDPLLKSALYQHLVLVPKGVFQISKTILGPFSHTRNFTSNSVFTAAQGNFFMNPAEMALDFKKSFAMIQPQILYRNLPKDQQMYKFLSEQNVMGSSATAKDLHGLLDDMAKGGDFYTRMVNKFNDKLKKVFPLAGESVEATAKGIKRGYQVATDLYMAEDELWKAYNFFAENYKYKNAYVEAVKSGVIKKMPEELTIMKEAAKIVRDTLPNYGFVPDFIKGMRRLPMGNFISWPAQIISTSASTLELGYKEMMNPVFKNIGIKRLASFGATTAIAIPTINAIGRGLYGVAENQVAAIREFVPLFSKENPLFVYKDKDGQLKYIDASGTFVYNVVTGPAQSVINAVDKEKTFNPNSPLMVGLYKGLVTGMGNLMKPFMEPSAYVTMALDLWARGGKTAEGYQIFNPEAPLGEKFSKGLEYIAKQYAPFSIPQFQRLEKAVTGTPGPRGEKYNVSDEIGGFYGLRGIPMTPNDVIKKMDYKISEFKTGIRNTRSLLTTETLKGGEISTDDIVQRFIVANEQRFRTMQKMKEVNDAAKLLNVTDEDLTNKFKARQELNAYKYIENNSFKPLDITTDIQKKYQEQYEEKENTFENLKFSMPYDETAIELIDSLKEIMKDIPLDGNFSDYIKPGQWRMKKSETPSGEQRVASAPLPPTPMPDTNIIQRQTTQQANVMQNGLTPTESALFSESEKIMRLKQRGLA